MGPNPILIMLTGLGGARKSTTAALLYSILTSVGYRCEIICGSGWQFIICGSGWQFIICGSGWQFTICGQE
jgi:adenylylsulfate kinase-like enzyme